MNLSFFIADRMAREGSGGRRLSNISNIIAWVSVALSVAVMIIAVYILQGFRQEISTKLSGFSGDIQLTLGGSGSKNDVVPMEDSLKYFDDIRSMGEVSSMDPVCYKTGILKGKEDIQGVYFKGVDSLYDLSFFKNALKRGRLPDFHGRVSSEIMVSKRITDILGYSVGDDVLAYYVGERVVLRKFKIVGIYDAQIEDIDKTLAIVDIRQTQHLNGWAPGQISNYELRLKRSSDIEKTSMKIGNLIMEKAKDGDQDVRPIPVRRLYSNLFDWLNLLNFNVLIVLILMIAVAGFNMISSLLIILFENTSTIGVLKSMGMTNGGVSKVFLYRALFIVLKGIWWGDAVAFVFSLFEKLTKVIKLNPENYFVNCVPVDINLGSMLLIDAASIVIIMLFLLLCSIFIAKVSPAKTMSVE
ncbi:MAG: ABC transporter permease [Bacteroidales bacterium]|nr:ABC transporter permease [Bacteroidales bacterium]